VLISLDKIILGGGLCRIDGLKDRIQSAVGDSHPTIKLSVGNADVPERSVYVGLTYAPDALPGYDLKISCIQVRFNSFLLGNAACDVVLFGFFFFVLLIDSPPVWLRTTTTKKVAQILCKNLMCNYHLYICRL
jgi:hypothetical protein